MQPRKDRKRRHVLAQGEMQKHKCCFCRVPLWYHFLGESGRRIDMATYEHAVPVSAGSSTTPKHNCLVSCWLCNSLRGVEDVYTFAAAMAVFGPEEMQRQRRWQVKMNKTESNRRKRKSRAARQAAEHKERFNDAHLTY